MKSFNTVMCLSALVACFTSSGVAVDSLEEANLFSMELSLPIAAGKKVLVNRVFGSDLGDGAFSWTGELAGDELGFASFSRVGDSISGTVHMSRGDAHVFRGQVDKLNARLVTSRTRSCASCRVIGTPSFDPRRQRRIKTWRNGDGNLVDLLVVYPSAVSDEAAGITPLAADVAKAVADANLCYRNSQVNLQLRLVHLAEVSYTPTGVLETDLERLAGTADGYMDDVHALRDQYGADLVALLTTDSDLGGLANLMNHPTLSFPSYGFSVNVWGQIGAPSYTLAHEIGHNMGCLHNRQDVTDSDRDYEFIAFSYGKRWESAGQGYRTVMSYDTKPTPTYPNTIPYFSNPDVSYLGETTGNTDTEDNAQVLRFTAPYVANFRPAVVQGIVLSLSSVTVREGNSTSLNVRLATKPASTITVTASFADGGDADLILSGPTTLSFDAGNWNLPHPIQVTANPDDDSTDGSAILTLSATGMTTTTVTVAETDVGTSIASGHLVSGVVTNSLGVGIAGATLAFSSAGGSVMTDANGTFRHTLAAGWNGILTPSKSGHTFTPESVTISSLSGDSVGKAFTAIRSNILYVNASATGSGNGSSWADAYTDLNAALRSEHPFDEVWVATGIYKPGIVRPASFLLPPNIAVYGGFVGTETSREERNATANLTFLSGDLGVANDDSDNAYHVVIPSAGSILDGFTIRDGNASENFSDDRGQGGALWAENVAFVVSNCTFTGHYAYQKGGAVYVKDANATFTNCFFTANTTGSTGSGGALDANNSRLTFASCTFASNVSQFEGGAINSQNSTLIFSNSSFTSNQNASFNGGGAAFFNDVNATFTSCTFTANTTGSTGSGGALDANNSRLTFASCTFASNVSQFEGGAINSQNSTLIFSNSSFTSNQNASFNGGGALNISGGSLSDINGTYSNNSCAPGRGGGAIQWAGIDANFTGTTFNANQSASYRGGAIIATTGALRFSKCVFSGNTSGARGGAVRGESVVLSFSNSSFTGNESAINGGALSVENAILTLTSNTFTSNKSEYHGGVLDAKDSNSTTTNCHFTSNLTGNNGKGGAIAVENGFWNDSGSFFTSNVSVWQGGAVSWKNATGSMVGSTFTSNSNTTYNGGGALHLEGTMPTISNCFFLGNQADSGGAFMVANNANSVTFVNCVFSGNKANNNGGVLSADGSTRFVNCTLTGNSANFGGVTTLFPGDSVSFENSILWGNSATSAGNDVFVNSQTATANNSLFDPAQSYGTLSGSGNLSSDPLFTDAEGPDNVAGTEDDDLTLQSSSPAINQASTSVTGYSTTDLLGKTRSGAPDIGAYEYRINAAPIFAQGTTAVLSISEDSDASFTYSATDTDADTLTWSMLSPSSNGIASVVGSSGVTSYVPNADWSGSDSFVVQVSDGVLTDEITVSVTVSSVADSPVITQGSGPLVLTMSEDGAPTAWAALTLGATDADTAVSSLTWSVKTAASNGTATVSGTGSAPVTFTYAPTENWSGSDSFVVQVSDGVLTDEITVNVTVSAVNDAPAITQGDGPLTVTMSEDGAPTDWVAPTLGGADTDTAAGSLTWSVKTAASNGTATVSGTGSAPVTFTYSPTENWSGSDSFVVQVSDGVLTDEIMVNVTVSAVNDAPAITQGNGPLTVTMSEDGAPTAWAAPTLGGTDTDTAAGSLTWSVKTAASNGTATVSGTGAAPVTFTYAPTENWSGSDSFVVQVSDGDLTDQITVNVTVSAVNDAPAITQGDGPLTVTMSEDGAPTAWAAPTLGGTDTDTAAGSLTWSVKTAASNGTATVSGTGSAPVTFTYAPTENWNGSDSFVVQLSDGVLTDEITVNVTVSAVNDASAITQGNGPLTVTMSEDGAPTVWAAPTLGGTDTDTAAGSLTWSVKTATSNGTATVSGTGAAPVTFTYAPTENWSGSDSFVVQVSDGDLMDQITVNVTVIPVNDPPRITNALSNGDLVTSIPENNATVLTLTATDVESDYLTFSIAGVDSSSFDLNVTTGVLSFKAAPDFENPDDANNDNIYELLVAVADGNTTSSSISLFVTVSDVIESAPQVLLTVTIDGNGAVTGSGSFDKDSSATLTATPGLGYVFSQWTGDLNETANPLTLVMAGPRSVNAVFKLTPDSWMLALDEGNGWLSFSWFGNYYETNIGWLYHEHHGWLYRVSESTNSVWLHDTRLGWLWTSSNTYPYLYQANPGGWLYYDKTSKSPRRFYRYSTNVWEEISGEIGVD